METKDIIIIGGGAAGLMASCAAAHVLKKRGSVLVLEGNAKLGRKLLATGNGRCNLTNLNVSPAHYHGDVTAIQDLLHEYTPEAICAVFREMGLVTKPDSEGRVYPQNQQAAAVLSALRWDAEKYGVSFSEEHTVSKIEKVKNGFTLICTDGTQLFTKQCILTCGGAASPRHSCGEGYTLAKQLGHTVTKLYPSLTQLTMRAKQWKTLSGTRAPANAVLLADNKPVYEESGEVQFTDTGISGICVFGLSIYAGEFFALGTIRNKKYASLAVQLDLLPDMAYQEVLDYLLEMTKLYPARAAGDLLSGLLNMRLGYMLVGAAGIAQSEPAVKIKAPQLKKLASLLKGWRLDITGTKDFSAAQVTAGGVPLTELDPHTMASKKAPGLYLAGEMLNIHGDCGGYNLHFAWASGITAGKSAAYRCLKEEKRRYASATFPCRFTIRTKLCAAQPPKNCAPMRRSSKNWHLSSALSMPEKSRTYDLSLPWMWKRTATKTSCFPACATATSQKRRKEPMQYRRTVHCRSVRSLWVLARQACSQAYCSHAPACARLF